MRHLTIVTLMATASDQQSPSFSLSLGSEGWGVFPVVGLWAKGLTRSLCHLYWYVVRRLTLQSTPPIVVTCTVEFQTDYYLSPILLSFHYFCLLANSPSSWLCWSSRKYNQTKPKNQCVVCDSSLLPFSQFLHDSSKGHILCNVSHGQWVWEMTVVQR